MRKREKGEREKGRGRHLTEKPSPPQDVTSYPFSSWFRLHALCLWRCLPVNKMRNIPVKWGKKEGRHSSDLAGLRRRNRSSHRPRAATIDANLETTAANFWKQLRHLEYSLLLLVEEKCAICPAVAPTAVAAVPWRRSRRESHVLKIWNWRRPLLLLLLVLLVCASCARFRELPKSPKFLLWNVWWRFHAMRRFRKEVW